MRPQVGRDQIRTLFAMPRNLKFIPRAGKKNHDLPHHGGHYPQHTGKEQYEVIQFSTFIWNKDEYIRKHQKETELGIGKEKGNDGSSIGRVFYAEVLGLNILYAFGKQASCG